MKPAETKAIYESACRAKRIVPQEEEGRTWHRVLREFDGRDVKAALDAWWADATPTSSGRPRGVFLPAPAELKPLVIAAQRKREAAAREPQDLLLWECEGEQRHRCSGFIARSKLPPACRCRYCNAHMRLVERGTA